MAWENRDGRRYYYRKQRVGQQVFSEYLGSGEYAELCSWLDEIDREESHTSAENTLRELHNWMELDWEINKIHDMCSDFLNAALLLAGYHTHRGQWRLMNDRR